MATSHLPATIPRLSSTTSNPNPFFLSPPNYIIKTKNNLIKTSSCQKSSRWVVRLRSIAHEESPPKPTAQKLVDFLYDDLPHLFDDQGIDRTAYDERVKFRDPITKHDSISGYLFNIAMLRKLFGPQFQLHWVKQTGPYEITTRWTMVMTFVLLPWKPELVFTGTSVMGINPETNKFCSHADYWDSIENNQYFSVEGLLDVVKQLRYYKTPDLETPKYQILKRTASYEVRKYEPFIVVETNGEKLSGSGGFNSVAGYIFGKNSAAEKIPMTTPVFTQAFDPEISKVSIQIVLPSGKDMSRFTLISLPAPNEEEIRLRKVEGGIAAVSKFSGKPIEDIVREKEKALRSTLIKDGLRPQAGCLLARYNDPGRTWSFTMRNEVLIWLEEYSLD
ncbi:hypothetical protein BUALT_Bualt12G0089700 [Buddleja alternifolia]|uniref:SOUL heme-binding protein n=1 Tax=Buddleja alternifolia TaxID=168488 RepID=A0AAV6X0G5_9LAMI|nr:hypothetical protein BUALT_Bualt12G0089700 [Buddleja alternifolia]